MNGRYLDLCDIPTLEEKINYFHTIIKERDKQKLSFMKIGENRGLSEKRIRNEYTKAKKVQHWESSDLWKILYELTKTYPASYAIRLYGYLLTHKISTVKSFQKTDIEKINAIKGVGVKYQKTVAQIKEHLAANTTA